MFTYHCIKIKILNVLETIQDLLRNIRKYQKQHNSKNWEQGHGEIVSQKYRKAIRNKDSKLNNGHNCGGQ